MYWVAVLDHVFTPLLPVSDLSVTQPSSLSSPTTSSSTTLTGPQLLFLSFTHMRCLFAASLAAAGIAGTLAHRVGDSPVRQRKSLGFGPVHKHAYYRSSPYQVVTNAFTRRSEDSDPLEVARLFVEDILADQLSESSSYKIRKDSYTDTNTGITHVYVRQMINGLEVSDGDMNINIKDGMVLSYGNSVCSSSFYFGRTNTNVRSSSSPDLLLPISCSSRVSMRTYVIPTRSSVTVSPTRLTSTATPSWRRATRSSWVTPPRRRKRTPR